jgi:hypothetical protein
MNPIYKETSLGGLANDSCYNTSDDGFNSSTNDNGNDNSFNDKIDCFVFSAGHLV